ncbi:MAG: histidine phosphatase family protein [bacterium]|nr:histidine phosphatase family protein [bacterium]
MDTGQTRIYLLRHGETVNTVDGRFRYNGHTDVDVTSRGIAQLEKQAEYLKDYPICRVYSSGLIRSLKGAKSICNAVSAEVHNDERLKEIHAGRWEALTVDEVQDQFPGEFEERFSDIVNFRIPGGENLLDVRIRSLEVIEELIERHRGQEIAIVAHGGINRLILCEAMGLDLKHLLRIEQGFGCLNIIDYYEKTSVVKLLNKAP